MSSKSRGCLRPPQTTPGTITYSYRLSDGYKGSDIGTIKFHSTLVVKYDDECLVQHEKTISVDDEKCAITSGELSNRSAVYTCEVDGLNKNDDGTWMYMHKTGSCSPERRLHLCPNS